MVRSICKVGLALALVTATAWVGLAWSQTPRASSSTAPEAAAVTMTVHENGKALQCRILSSWKCANGARAFQLEVLATGEKLTIMEDGPGNAFQSQSGRMRTLPMRIFHWGRSKTSPAGAPLPPDTMISEREIGEPKIIDESDAVLVRITPEPVAPPGCEICSGVNCGKNATTTCDCCNTPCEPRDDGQPGGRLAARAATPYSSMQGSFSCETTNIEPPAATAANRPSPAPAAKATELAQGDSNKPKITETARPDATPPKEIEAARPAPPPLLAQGPVGPPALPGDIEAKPLTPPKTEPSAPTMPTSTDQGPTLAPAPGAVQTVPTIVQPMPTMPTGMPSKQPRGLVNRIRNAISPDVGRAPEPLTNRVGPDLPETRGPQIAEMAQNPAAAAPSKPPSPQQASLPSTNPRSEPLSGDGTPSATPSGAMPPPAQGPGSFPIMSEPMTSPGLNFPGGQSSPTNPGNRSGAPLFPGVANRDSEPRGSKPATLPAPGASTTGKAPTFPGLGGVHGQPRPGYPPAAYPQKPATNEQRDWRTMWGKPPAGQAQTPGQSLVEPTPSGKGPAFQPKNDGVGGTRSPQTMPPMPPTSMAQNPKQADPLLSPEKFGTPRVDSKTRGDARTKEPMPQPPAANVKAPAASVKAPAATTPLGVQSVMAAHNGLDMPLRYIPVPTVTIPQPVRPPGPPKPEIPNAPAPTNFVNAFSSPKPPDNNGGPNGPQNGPPGAGMGSPYAPMVDPRQMQGMYMPNMPYGPGPGMNPGMMPPPGMRAPTGATPEMLAALAMFPNGGDALYRGQRPVAHMNYPRTYQGPMAPNPVGGGNMNPQAYMPALQPYYAPAPAYPPAPSYPQGYAPMPPVAVPMPQEFGADPAQLLSVLVQSPYPAQREWAVMGLAALDLRAQPEILQALLAAARKDPAASVRAGCIQCVARQNVAAQPVLQTFHALKSDPDPRVRNDAEQALIRLTGSFSTVPTQPVQPINAQQ